MATLKLLVVLLYYSVLVSEIVHTYDIKLSQVYFDGGFLVFPVKRAKVQERLDVINKQFDNYDVPLYLPTTPVLQDIITSDEHVILFGFGNMTAVAFNDVLTNAEKEITSTVLEAVGTMVPYLSSQENSNRVITFQDTLFSSGGDSIKVNLILPTEIVADRLVRITDGNRNKIRFEKNDLLFRATGVQQGPCNQPYQHVIDDIQEFENELQISTSGPDFSVCDRFPDIEVDLCNVYRDPQYKQLLKEAGNNVCIYWKPTSDVQNCKSKFRVQAMSQQMRDLLLLDDEPNVLEAEIQKGTFDIRLVFPCL